MTGHNQTVGGSAKPIEKGNGTHSENQKLRGHLERGGNTILNSNFHLSWTCFDVARTQADGQKKIV